MNFDLAQALYWYLTENYSGQGSPEYKMLSQVQDVYRPGMIEKGPRTEEARGYYQELENGTLSLEEAFDEVMEDDNDEDDDEDEDEDEDEDDDEVNEE